MALHKIAVDMTIKKKSIQIFSYSMDTKNKKFYEKKPLLIIRKHQYTQKKRKTNIKNEKTK